MVVITKDHTLGDLNKRHLVLRILEARKFKTKVLANWIPSENFFWFIDGRLLTVSSHDKRERDRQRGKKGWGEREEGGGGRERAQASARMQELMSKHTLVSLPFLLRTLIPSWRSHS